MSKKSLIVLSRPGCVQCTATYRALDKKNIEYTIDDALSEANHNGCFTQMLPRIVCSPSYTTNQQKLTFLSFWPTV